MISNKIEGYIRFKKSFGIENLRIVMSPDAYNKLKSECNDEIILQADGSITFRGYPLEIYNKIATDFYVCENNIGE